MCTSARPLEFPGSFNDCVMHVLWVPMQGEADDRYEPLPGFFELPAWLWRKLPPAGKAAVAAAGAGLVVLAIVLSPVIQRSKDRQAREDAAASARLARRQIAEIRKEQIPRFARGTPAGRDLTARAALVTSAAASIKRDAGKRAAAGEFHGPILRVQCRPFPPSDSTVPADRQPSMRTGRYGCLAVTSDIPATSGNRAGVVGHPYRTKIDFRSGRYAFCKIRGRPGELAVRANNLVPVPKVCGG
jgi:type II secretory pathway pseudopilin PulG